MRIEKGVTRLRITAVHERSVSLESPIANAYIDFRTMTASVVAIVTDVIRDGRPVIGYGFNSNGRYGASGLLRERFIPRLRQADPEDMLNDQQDNFDPLKIWDVLMRGEKPGGHGERSVAVGVLDMALWDIVAKVAQKPLHQLLAEQFGDGKPAERVFVYAAGGYYAPAKGLPQLQDEMRRYLDLGYTHVKIKIGGASLAEDLRRVEAVLEVVGEGSRLAVDANGRFGWDKALQYAEALAPYRLFWYEEAGDPLDYALQAALSDVYPHPLATGENLFSHQDARNLLRYGNMRPGLDYLQFDCALSYGLVEYLRTLALLPRFGWSSRRVIPHGGHQMSLNIAAGLHLGGNESYPGVFEPFGGFADHLTVEGGFVALPESPGIGFEEKQALYGLLQTLGP